MTKKILFVVSGSKFFISHRLTLAKAAKSVGYEIHVATPASALDHLITDAGLIHHPISLDRGGLNPFKDVMTIFNLWRLYHKIKPDIIHHVTVKPILYGTIAARWAKVPAVINAFTGLGFIFINQSRAIRWMRRLIYPGYRYAFRHPNMKVIFQNTDDRQYFVNARLLQSHQCLLIKGSGVVMSDFMPSEEIAGDIVIVLAA